MKGNYPGWALVQEYSVSIINDRDPFSVYPIYPVIQGNKRPDNDLEKVENAISQR